MLTSRRGVIRESGLLSEGPMNALSNEALRQFGLATASLGGQPVREAPMRSALECVDAMVGEYQGVAERAEGRIGMLKDVAENRFHDIVAADRFVLGSIGQKDGEVMGKNDAIMLFFDIARQARGAASMLKGLNAKIRSGRVEAPAAALVDVLRKIDAPTE